METLSQPLPSEPKSSNAGRASVWVGLIALASWIGIVAISSTVHATFGRANVESPIYYALGIWIVLTLLLTLFGLVLGVAGVCAPRGGSRNAALIGLLLNLALPIGILLLTVLAMLADPNPQPVFTPGDPNGPTRKSLGIGGVVLAACVGGVVILLRRIVRKGEPSMAMAYSPAVLERMQRAAASTPAAAKPIERALVQCKSCPQKLPATATFCRRCGHRLTSL